MLITFDDFVVDEDLGFCLSDRDWVAVYDGPNALAPALGTFCGDVSPPLQVSSTDTITITMVTDGDVQKQGFQLTWTFVG